MLYILQYIQKNNELRYIINIFFSKILYGNHKISVCKKNVTNQDGGQARVANWSWSRPYNSKVVLEKSCGFGGSEVVLEENFWRFQKLATDSSKLIKISYKESFSLLRPPFHY